MNASSDGHYLDLPNARLVPTRTVLRTQKQLQSAIKLRAMLCIHGGVGLGKTLTVRTCLRDLAPDNTLFFQFHRHCPLGDIQKAVAAALDIPDTTRSLTPRIRAALAERPYVLVFDETQGLTTDALEWVRPLWDTDDNRPTIIFVGAEDTRRHLRRRAALASRVTQWPRFSPLHPTEVVQHMPTYHPVWSKVGEEDLLWLDDAACRGNFRDWAKLTSAIQEILTERGQPLDAFTRAIAREALATFDPSDLHLPPDDDL
ncbi:ATP-binding protein [Streptomyces sp. NBC_00343]|uniref:ATP-binding protein n=1 Tax=Streptomyces sp. NBC_00343 TaxID=2975719 RepID=UPI002E2DCD3A|nr:ATP-binding protein [Streptomyces sp. NBC_00343]